MKLTTRISIGILSIATILTAIGVEPGLTEPQVRQGQKFMDQNSPGFRSFMAQLKKQIVRVWFPPHRHEYDRVTTLITIDQNGALLGSKIAKTSGFDLSDKSALKAIENAAPFPNLPEGAGKTAEVRFTFDYAVLHSEAASAK